MRLLILLSSQPSLHFLRPVCIFVAILLRTRFAHSVSCLNISNASHLWLMLRLSLEMRGTLVTQLCPTRCCGSHSVFRGPKRRPPGLVERRMQHQEHQVCWRIGVGVSWCCRFRGEWSGATTPYLFCCVCSTRNIRHSLLFIRWIPPSARCRLLSNLCAAKSSNGLWSCSNL